MALIISTLLFFGVGGLVLLFGYRRYVLAGRVYENLENAPNLGSSTAAVANPDFFSVKRIAAAVARKLPASAQTASLLQLKLMSAGYRDQSAAGILYGLKLLTMAALTIAMLAIELHSQASALFRIVGILVGIIAGFRLPDYVLARRVTRRRKSIRKALPDALDLIIVCAEAGLTIDRAFRNVTQQLAIVHRELADELSLVTAEISAGLRRREALDNLAIRTQEPEIRKFVAVVAQADRFGTSMGDALRTHAEYMRVKRRQEAEEKASKVSVKMIFPIFFFIMPCMMLVTVGPAVILIMKNLIPALSGGMK
jgi:tight adherence protein C